MKSPTASEILFSLKSFVASMIALYIAMRIGLPRPFWAMMTAYVVANPFAGPTRSKAVFRVGGTVIGSLATIVMVPRLANAPELLSLAIAGWVGVCLYFSLLDRTPRSYVLMLAGYTAALITFPAVSEPATIFDVALARVEEIFLGILCATLVHSLVFPQSFGPVLLARLDHALRDARHWIADALAGDRGGQSRQDRHKLATDITELRLMATHLPFDTSNLRWTADAVHALQERLAALMPLITAIEDRLSALRRIDGQRASRWQAVLRDIVAWNADGAKASEAQGAALRQHIAAQTPGVDRDSGWEDLLEVNLAVRLTQLIEVCEECRVLRRHLDDDMHGRLPEAARRQPGLPPRVLHLDHRLALMSSLAAVVAILACCAFWIVTGWPAGAAAPMMAGVFCCFFATQDDPVPGIMLFLKYTLVSIPISALYLLVLLPAVHSFEMMALVIAPCFLFLGVLIARPATAGQAMATLFGVAGMLSLQDTNTADMASFINGMLAQLAGITAAVVFTRLFRTVSAAWSARRLREAAGRELARLAPGKEAPSLAEFAARMVDRIGLLTPRLATASAEADAAAAQALADLRVGLNMAHLLHLQPALESRRMRILPMLRQLSAYLRQRAGRHDTRPALLSSLDDALRSACAASASPEKHDALAALAGLRRDLFPDALPYRPPSLSVQEIQ